MAQLSCFKRLSIRQETTCMPGTSLHIVSGKRLQWALFSSAFLSSCALHVSQIKMQLSWLVLDGGGTSYVFKASPDWHNSHLLSLLLSSCSSNFMMFFKRAGEGNIFMLTF